MILRRLDRNRLPDLRLALGMILPMAAGITAFGWRAIGTSLLVALGAGMTQMLLNRLRSWPGGISRFSICIQSVLLSLFLPATLCDIDTVLLSAGARWPLPIALGVVLAFLTWLIARTGSARVSPVVLTLLIASLAAAPDLRTDRVLQRNHLLQGDLLDTRVAPRSTATAEPWLTAAALNDTVVLIVTPAWQRLEEFLRGRVPSDRPAWTISRLVSDDLPPLEDLVVIGHPNRIGCASAIAILIGGLFLIHRRMAAFRLPLVMLLGTIATLLILPTPIIVSSDEIIRRWLPASDPRVGWATGITFANYLLIASPALLTIFFLAIQPGIRPLGGRAGMVYALLTGVFCGAATIFLTVETGPLLAVAISQFLTPTLERRLPPGALL